MSMSLLVDKREKRSVARSPVGLGWNSSSLSLRTFGEDIVRPPVPQKAADEEQKSAGDEVSAELKEEVAGLDEEEMENVGANGEEGDVGEELREEAV
jgi:hypothetical protein